MRAVRFRDPQLFLQRAEPFLLTAEAENNLMLGIGQMRQTFGDDAYLAAVTEGNHVVACAMRTPPYKAVITRASGAALECLVEDLADRYPDLPEVLGPEPDVAVFADLWAARTGVPSVQGTRQRLFDIREPPRPARWPAGAFRKAEERDLPIITAWIAAFIAEAVPGDPTDPKTHAIERVASNTLYLWEDERPVAMAGWSGQTRSGVRVNFVYTPPEYRRRGYASACVARLTQQLFLAGREFCCLYTDLRNQTANSIYQKIGYRPVCDMSNYVLCGHAVSRGGR